jgi:hypothetical protein
MRVFSRRELCDLSVARAISALALALSLPA